MIRLVPLLPLICPWRRQIYSLTYLGKSSIALMEVSTCTSVSLMHAKAPLLPRPPKFNFKRADWASFRAIADVDISGEDIDTKVSNATHSILHAAAACIPRTATVHTKHGVSCWTTDCRQARYRYFSQQPSHDNFIAYKKARAQARKVILNAKRNSFRQFVTTINQDHLPLTIMENHHYT